MAENLLLESTDRGDWTVLSVKGEVDLYTAPRLKERLAELTGKGRTNLAVDLQGVEFMDSTGLGVLIGALKAVQGGRRHPGADRSPGAGDEGAVDHRARQGVPHPRLGG